MDTPIDKEQIMHMRNNNKQGTHTSIGKKQIYKYNRLLERQDSADAHQVCRNYHNLTETT